jgi:spore germination cell wall hydrolase CwlJ-like protein
LTGATLLFALLLAGKQRHDVEVTDRCLAYTAMREAGGESAKAQRGVIEVVRHRMYRQHKSCVEVVSQSHQFSWWHRKIDMKVDDEALQSYREAIILRRQLPKCAQWFHDTSIRKPGWAREMRKVKQLGNIVYYCDD